MKMIADSSQMLSHEYIHISMPFLHKHTHLTKTMLSVNPSYTAYTVYYMYAAMLYHSDSESTKSHKTALICELLQIQVDEILKTCW